MGSRRARLPSASTRANSSISQASPQAQPRPHPSQPACAPVHRDRIICGSHAGMRPAGSVELAGQARRSLHCRGLHLHPSLAFAFTSHRRGFESPQPRPSPPPQPRPSPEHGPASDPAALTRWLRALPHAAPLELLHTGMRTARVGATAVACVRPGWGDSCCSRRAAHRVPATARRVCSRRSRRRSRRAPR